jgi:hypothetical protein
MPDNTPHTITKYQGALYMPILCIYKVASATPIGTIRQLNLNGVHVMQFPTDPFHEGLKLKLYIPLSPLASPVGGRFLVVVRRVSQCFAHKFY